MWIDKVDDEVKKSSDENFKFNQAHQVSTE